jgi:hypothetical protein
MNGLIVKRGDKYLARKGCKSARPDDGGNYWSREVQAARVFLNHDAACRAARKFGGIVKLMKNGRMEGEEK